MQRIWEVVLKHEESVFISDDFKIDHRPKKTYSRDDFDKTVSYFGNIEINNNMDIEEIHNNMCREGKMSYLDPTTGLYITTSGYY